MRSSIACSRCRRSKIKCQNDGTNTQCKACNAAGKECTYPIAATGSTSTPKRSEPTNGTTREGEPDVKRIRKREAETVRKQSRDEGNPLETPPISKKMWDGIFEAFMLHCSAELPFLHATTFNRMRNELAGTSPPEVQDFFLGMLALTARYIPELVSYHGATPLAASEFYATALTNRLDARAFCKPSIERCQALLMLGLYSWGMRRGVKSWTMTGNAIVMAELLGLFREEDSENCKSRQPSLPEDMYKEELKATPWLKNRSQTLEPTPVSNTESIWRKEIKRRTMFSIFILDKFLSSGYDRRERVRSEDLRIQLPCSEEDFRFGIDVKTSYLSQNDSSQNGNAHLDSSQVLAVYIRLIEIYGKATQWSCNGGRRYELVPPWDSESTFFKLRKELDRFHASLPPKLRHSPSNVEAHMGGKEITAFVVIHTIYSLVRIVLHREYLPFIAIRCERPCGPLDPPVFLKEDTPEGFWEESAEHVFKAARDIMELVKGVSSHGYLVESLGVGYAIYQAGFVGVYSINFPHMDVGSYMCDVPHSAKYNREWKGFTGLAISTIRDLQPRMKQAERWLEILRGMFIYYRDVQTQHTFALVGKSATENTAVAALRTLRHGGDGGGLEEYKCVEQALIDFGTLNEDRATPATSESDDRIRPATTSEASSGTYIKREPSAHEMLSWNAVNNQPANDHPRSGIGISNDPAARQAATTLFHTYNNQHPRGPTSNPPSLLSPPNSSSTPSNLNSPYTNAPSIANLGEYQNGYATHPHAAWPQNGYDHATRDPSMELLRQADGVPFGGGMDLKAFTEGNMMDGFNMAGVWIGHNNGATYNGDAREWQHPHDSTQQNYPQPGTYGMMM